MNVFTNDPINTTIYGEQGIKKTIEFNYANGFVMATLILIFSYIDAMSNLIRPADHAENSSKDFKEWVRRYIHLKGTVEVTPDDLWGARNAIVHTYGQESRDVRAGKAHIISWVMGVGLAAAWVYETDEHPDHIIVSVESLKDAFVSGIDCFLIDVYTGKYGYDKTLIEERFDDIIMPYTDPVLLNKLK